MSLGNRFLIKVAGKHKIKYKYLVKNVSVHLGRTAIHVEFCIVYRYLKNLLELFAAVLLKY